MGLDQYLRKKIYIGANYEHNKIEGEINLTRDGVPIKIDLKKVTSITEEAAYWRKSNSIHKFFVEEVQDGNDDCKEYYVDTETLKKLVKFCKEDVGYFNTLVYMNSDEHEDFFTKEKFTYKIYTNVDEEKLNLTTTPGFFFGSTEYNEYYVRDLEETIKIIEPLLEEKGSDYYYSSSW